MNEYYDGPVIDSFQIQNGGVVLPDEAYDTPQMRISDLRAGEWGMPKQGNLSVFRDIQTNTTVIDTFDAQGGFVSEQLVWSQPFIKVIGDPGKQLQYMIDARRMDKFRFPARDYDLELGEDSEPFLRKQKQFGSRVVRMLVVRHFNEVVAYGDEYLQIPAARFAQEIDDFMESERGSLRKGNSVRIPSHVLAERDTRYHCDLDTEFSMTEQQSSSREQ